MPKAVAVIMLALLVAMWWGLGVAAQRLGNSKSPGRPTAIGIGLAVSVFIGGVLNLAHLAYRPAFWVLLAGGLLLCMLELRRAHFSTGNILAGRGEIVAAGIVIIAATAFAISTQLPPAEFNFHDDLQKYFSHPVRMLATGTLAGSPLNALGSETLGAQAFLHAFLLSVLPIGYINGVDAVLGFFLLMLFAASAGWRRFSWFPGAALGPLFIAAINPQYVNVSSLYVGALLMATAVMLVADDRESVPHPFVLGLIYAAMVASKTTFALFPLLHLPFAALALQGTLGSAKASLKWAAQTILWAAVGLLPWGLLFLPNYLAHSGFNTPSAAAGNDGTLNLFSRMPLFYGATFLDYTAIVVAATFIATLSFIAYRRSTNAEQSRRSLGLLAGAAGGVLSFLIIVVLLGPALNGYETNLRYAIPFLLGTCVTCIVMAPTLSKTIPRWASMCAPTVAALLITLGFVPSMIRRDRQAVRFGSTLAFAPLAESPAYVAYSRFAFSDAAEQQIIGIQNQVPKDEPIVAWINMPFLLDYKRNPIIDADTTGISSPWARIPGGAHYVLWQYKGYGVRGEGDYVQAIQGPGKHERTIAVRAMAFANDLSKLAGSSKVIASDSQFVLFELRSVNSN